MSEMIEVTTNTRATIAVSSQGESWGDIVLKFYPDVAPDHAKNFCKLAAQNFYDGTTFHRVIPGFMVQGGDPNSKNTDRSNHGMGGPGYHIKAEFNAMQHKRGVLSMARAQDPDSAGSQFFICVADSLFSMVNIRHSEKSSAGWMSLIASSASSVTVVIIPLNASK